MRPHCPATQLTLISFSGQTNKAEDRGQEEVVKEKEVANEKPSEATAEVVQGGGARDLPGSLKTPRKKPHKERPPDVQSELHPLQYR